MLVVCLAWAGACSGGGALTGTGGAGASGGGGGTATGGSGGGNAAGGATIVVTIDAGTPTVLAAGAANGPWDIAVDATHVYWADSPANAVRKVPKTGGATVTLASEQTYVRHIAVDSTHVYWVGSPGVMKVPLAGGTPVVVAEQQGVTDVAADAAGVYWALAGTSIGAPSSAIMKAARDTGAVTKLTADAIFWPVEIAIDATAVYWMTSGEPFSLIQKVSLAGGSATGLVGGVTPAAMASDGANLYFTNYDVQKNTSALMKVPVGGGDATPVVSFGAGSTVVDGVMLYFAAGATIYRVSKDGGAATAIPTGDDGINKLVVDATHLYWTTQGGRVMALAKP